MRRLGRLTEGETWVQNLAAKYPWIADFGVLTAYQCLAKSPPDIDGALGSLQNARDVYFFEANRLLGDMLIALAAHTSDRQQHDIAARELARWRYLLPNHQQVGVFFSWRITSASPEDMLVVRRSLEHALDLEPRSVDAWSRLAELLTFDYLQGWDNSGLEHLAQAEYAVQQALNFDPRFARAHYAAGLVNRAKGRHKEALMEFDEALSLNPNFARAYAEKGNQLINVGQLDEAQKSVHEAIRVSPYDSARGEFYWILGRANFFMNRYYDAILWLMRSINVTPFVWYNRLYLISSYALTGLENEFLQNLIEFNRVFPRYTLQRVVAHERRIPTG